MDGLLVVDASAVVSFLVEQGARAAAAAKRMQGVSLVAPELIGYEVLNVLRRLRASGAVSTEGAEVALRAWHGIDVETWPLASFEARAWALTGAMSLYDASYVALAERLGAPLLTADRRLAAAPGVRAEVVVI